jgi:hypothetical protein
MPDFDKYFMVNDPIEAGSRAVDAWNRILANPTTITIRRQSEWVEQTVRIETLNQSRPIANNPDDAADVTQQQFLIFGVRDHPSDDIDDTNIQPGDRFGLSGDVYKIVNVNLAIPGEVRALAQRTQS